MSKEVTPVYTSIMEMKPEMPKPKAAPVEKPKPKPVPKASPPKKLPKGASAVDQMIYDFEVENGNGEFLFERISDGNYKFGTKKCTAKISNGVCLIRVGGGYMDIAEFY
jgi:hypothetical protein